MINTRIILFCRVLFDVLLINSRKFFLVKVNFFSLTACLIVFNNSVLVTGKRSTGINKSFADGITRFWNRQFADYQYKISVFIMKENHLIATGSFQCSVFEFRMDLG